MNYEKVVPEDSFIGRYLQYMKGQETPVTYDFWCAVWLLGNAAGRNVVVSRPRAPVHLNWYLILVAESGVTRKSSAVRVAEKLLYEVVDPEEVVGVRMTREALEYKLNDMTKQKGHATARICISEMVTFLGKQGYAMEMPGLLTDLYDCPDKRFGGGTVSKGKIALENVYCSILTASTPSWLVRAVNPDVIEGGFTSRTIFVIDEKRKKRIAWSKEDELKDVIQQEKLKEDLQAIKARAGDTTYSIEASPRAIAKFERWYKYRHESDDPFQASFEAREDAHILRLAACLSINAGRWKVSATDIGHAIKLIQAVKEPASELFGSGYVNDRIVHATDIIRRSLLEAGIDGLRHDDIRKRVSHYMNAKRLRTLLKIMHELNMVECFETINEGAGKPAIIWRATSTIFASGNSGDLMRRLNELEPDYKEK